VVPIWFLGKKFKECEKGDDITPFDGTDKDPYYSTQVKNQNADPKSGSSKVLINNGYWYILWQV
jgi:hypothetical protein